MNQGYNAQHICCDLTKRMFNDVQVLVNDVGASQKLQICHQQLEAHYSNLNLELQLKLGQLIETKMNRVGSTSNISLQKITDFINFIKLVQRSVILKLEDILKDFTFISTLDGVPLLPLLNEIAAFATEAEKLRSYFTHRSCWQLFINLSGKVTDEIYPELYMMDSLEKSVRFLLGASPSLARLIGLVNVFSWSSRYTTPEALFRGVITQMDNQQTISMDEIEESAIEECNMPMVEHSSQKLPELVCEVSQWLLSLLPEQKVSIRRLQRPSLTNLLYTLDSPYNSLSNISSKRSKYKKRTTPYSFQAVADLAPIRLHQLILPPID